MSDLSRSHRARVAVALVIVTAVLTPVVVRNWGMIEPMLPVWSRMLGETALLFAGLIALTAIIALLVSRRGKRWNGDA